MALIDSAILITTFAALFAGSRKLRFRNLLAVCIGLALVCWFVRCVVLLLDAPDAAEAEDYFNGMTLTYATSEVAIFALWLLVCSKLGAMVARLAGR